MAKPHFMRGALMQPALTPLREYRAWPHKTKIIIYTGHIIITATKYELNARKEYLKPINVLYCKKTVDLLLKRTCISVHFSSKNFVLVNAMKILTYGNQFLLAFRVALPALADNI